MEAGTTEPTRRLSSGLGGGAGIEDMSAGCTNTGFCGTRTEGGLPGTEAGEEIKELEGAISSCGTG